MLRRKVRSRRKPLFEKGPPGAGMLLGIAVSIAILALAAVLVCKAALPMGAIGFIAELAMAAGAYAAGYHTAKKRRNHGLLTGLLCGGSIGFLTWVIGWLYNGVPGSLLWKIIIMSLCGGIGGVLGVNTRLSHKG